MKIRKKILLTRALPKPGMDLLNEYFKLKIGSKENAMTKSEIINEIAGHDALICLLTDHIDAEIIRASRQLRVIANFAVGYNNIDIKTATKLKIPVTNTPGVLTETTADLTFALLLTIARRIIEADRFTRQGKFTGWSPMLFLGQDIYNKTLGVIGMGRIGRAVAHRAKGFNMRILYYDTLRLSEKEENDLGIHYAALDKLLQESDFVSIHVPLNKQTHHLINLEKLELMKKSAYIINVARGAVIDEKGLVTALKNKIIAGCGLDVYENEPDIQKELLELKNTVVVPHIGSASIETRSNMALITANNVISVLIDKTRAPHTVNPEVYE